MVSLLKPATDVCDPKNLFINDRWIIVEEESLGLNGTCRIVPPFGSCRVSERVMLRLSCSSFLFFADVIGLVLVSANPLVNSLSGWLGR